MHRYSDEEIDFLRRTAPGTGHRRLTDLFNERFGAALTAVQISGTLKRYGIKNGVKTTFQKGGRAWNKGMKGLVQLGGATKFTKGHMPRNHRPVGSERKNKDGYAEIKVAEPNVWQLKHVYLWTQKNGPPPKGHVVVFANGNRENYDTDNLLLLSRAQLAVMNKRGYTGISKETTEAGAAVSELVMLLSKRKKGS